MPEETVLERWNAMTDAEAAVAILPCCGSRVWAQAMASRRPIKGVNDLVEIATEVWRGLDRADWTEAFASHPRIGERTAQTARAESLAWSGDEQSRAMGAEASMRERLREANARYEARFGRIFLICASGRSAEEILAFLEERLGHDEATEWDEAGEQQRQITALRLVRWTEGV